MKAPFLALVLAIPAIDAQTPPGSKAAMPSAAVHRPTPSRTLSKPTEAETAVGAWLKCTECNGGELSKVGELAPQTVPILGAILHNGPPQALIEQHQQHLVNRYRALQAYGKTHENAQVPQTQDVYVKRNLAKYVTAQRIRAAQALGSINSPDARDALDRAQKLELSPDVRQAIEKARGRTKR